MVMRTVSTSNQKSLPLFVAVFLALFVLSGIGNGSTHKMIPSIFDVKARVAIASGEPMKPALMRARQLSGAVIGGGWRTPRCDERGDPNRTAQ